MGKRLLGDRHTMNGIGSTAPSGNVGIDMTLYLEGARARWWLITVVITGAAATPTVWGALPAGAPDDASDDFWGVLQDEFGTYPKGVLGTALPVGTYHFIIDGPGLFSRVFFTKGSGDGGATVNVHLTEIYDAERAN